MTIHESLFSDDQVFGKRPVLNARKSAADSTCLIGLPESSGWTQRQGAICIKRLPAGPAHGIVLPLDLNLCLELQSFPLSSLGQVELRLANLSGKGIADVQATARERSVCLVENCNAKGTGHARDAVVGEAENEPWRAMFLVGPYPGGTHSITDAARKRVDR